MLLEGVDLAAKVASFMRKDPNFASRASEEIFDLMLDEIVLGVCFDIHKSIKTGEFRVHIEIIPVTFMTIIMVKNFSET